MATNQTKPIPFSSVLENNKLDGTNFNTPLPGFFSPFLHSTSPLSVIR